MKMKEASSSKNINLLEKLLIIPKKIIERDE